MRRTLSYLLVLGLSASGLTAIAAPRAAAAEYDAALPAPVLVSDAEEVAEGDSEEGAEPGTVVPAAYRKAQPAAHRKAQPAAHRRTQPVGPTPAPMPAPSVQVPAPTHGATTLDDTTSGEVIYDDGYMPMATGAGGQLVSTRLWVEADYLMWWMEGFNTPALVTSSPLGGNGQLGDPNTTVAFGDEPLAGGIRSGARFRGAYWLDQDQTWAVTGDFWFVENKGGSESFVSDNQTLYWRPFTNAQTNVEDAQFADDIRVRWRSRAYSAGAGLRHYLCGACCIPCDTCGCDSCDGCGGGGGIGAGWGYRLDLLAGYRFFALNESLAIGEQATFGPVVFNVNDRFSTRNHFNGVEFGFLGEFERGPWSINGWMRTALGVTNQVVDLQGSSSQIPVAPIQDPTPGGLLVQLTNTGRTSTDDFAVLSEVGTNLGYQWTSRLRTTIGYTFIYLSRVARPGDQIDPKVDPRFLDPNEPYPFNPPAINPERELVTTDVWLQGLSFGLQFDY